MRPVEDEHARLALDAADQAEVVLALFEEASPGDHRPADAIEAARAWARGEITIDAARDAAYGAHTAAREAHTAEAVAAARAAGHAAATAENAGHAPHARQYADRATAERTRRDGNLSSP
jgi:hypothetical protein